MSGSIAKRVVADIAGISRGLYSDLTNGKREMTKGSAMKLAAAGGKKGDEWVEFFVMDYKKIHPTMCELLSGS